jgi:hypothetical protein
VNVRESVLSLEVSPSVTSDDVIAIVGAVVSNVTLPDPLVTAVPAFPAISLKAILKVTAPAVSLALAVYAAVQVFPLVLLYVMEVSVIAAPPDLKVTTGDDIFSLAVNVSVTTSSAHSLSACEITRGDTDRTECGLCWIIRPIKLSGCCVIVTCSIFKCSTCNVYRCCSSSTWCEGCFINSR